MDDQSPASLSLLLAHLRYQELRAIMARLGLGRQRTQNQKAVWIAAIAQAWLDPRQQASFVGRLSPAARLALWRLLQGGALPTLLFLAEYGAVRLPSATQSSGQMAPWRQPQTVSEELFYQGLLLPTTDQTLDAAPWLVLPWVLRQGLLLHFIEQLGFTALSIAPPPPLPTQPPPLLHDLAQLLIYLHQQRPLTLLHGRWLAPRHLQSLNQRLLLPERSAPLASHKRARWLVFLTFLATAAELHAEGCLTPAGWQWLAASPAQQLRLLWEAWVQAAHTTRLAYDQPMRLPPPWPQLVLPYLADTFGPAGLTNMLLAMATDWQAYFVTYLSNLQGLDQENAHLLAVLEHRFAAITLTQAIRPASPSDLDPSPMTWLPDAPAGAEGEVAYDQPPYVHLRYQLTTLGQWLLQRPHAKPPRWRWSTRAALTDSQDMLTITLALNTSPLAQAQLAAFAQIEQAADVWVADTGVHHYRLDATSVGQAAAAQVGLPILLAACQGLKLCLTTNQLMRLQQWYAAGRQLHFSLLPVLRTTDAALMAQIQQTPTLHKSLGDDYEKCYSVKIFKKRRR